MTDDRLLKELAQVARAQQAKDPDEKWDRLAADALGPEERARLQEEARSSPEAAAAWDAFRPMDAEFRSEIVEQVRHSLGDVQPAARALRRLRFPWRLAVPAALAASLLLAFLLPWRGTAPLPAYELRLQGSVRTERSGGPGLPAAGRAVFADGNRFELGLTPERSAGEEVEVRVYVAGDDRIEELAAPPPSRSSDGAVRIAGVVGEDVRLPRGEFTLLVVAARPGSLPPAAELRERLARSSPVREERWTAWSLRLRGVASP
jgi:hypothetical protein